VLQQAGPGGVQDLHTPGLPAFLGDPRHAISVPKKEGTFALDMTDGSVVPLGDQNEYSFSYLELFVITLFRPGASRQVNTSVVTAVVCIALGAVAAAMASLNVALPDLARSTGATQTQLEWIIDAYSLVFAALLLPAGALGDRFGRRRALLAGLVIFGGASAAAMTASSANELIGLRGLIGLGAALVMPATLSTITGTFPPAERTRAVSVWAAVAGGSALLGLLGTGTLLQWFSWRSAFAVNVVLAVIAIAGTIGFVPESSHPGAPPLDKAGAGLAMAGLIAVVFSIIEAPEAGWASARTLGGIGGGLAILAVFAGWELRAAHPMLDPRHFRNRRLSAGSLSIFIQFFAFFGFTFVALQYLQGVRGDSPLAAALAVLPLSAAMMPTARITPRLTARFGARTVSVAGLVLVAAGLTVISRVGTTSPYWLLLAGLIPLGIGMGAAMTPATAAVTEGLPAEQQGVGSALNDLSREVGGALGIAVIGSIVTAVYRANLHLAGVPAGLAGKARGSFALAIHAGGPVKATAGTAFTDGIHTGLLYAAAAAVVAAITVAILLPGHSRRRPAAAREDQPRRPGAPARTTTLVAAPGAATQRRGMS
jgi:EmrB/QacA subfamily drug resistance transporter